MTSRSHYNNGSWTTRTDIRAAEKSVLPSPNLPRTRFQGQRGRTGTEHHQTGKSPLPETSRQERDAETGGKGGMACVERSRGRKHTREQMGAQSSWSLRTHKKSGQSKQQVWIFFPKKRLVHHIHSLAEGILADMLTRTRIAKRLLQLASRI